MKEREDVEDAGEYLDVLLRRGEKELARKSVEALGDVKDFGEECPFKVEFAACALSEKEGVEKMSELARKLVIRQTNLFRRHF